MSKPIVDILAVVTDSVRALAALKESGWDYRGEYNIPMRHFFERRGVCPVNLHVYEEGHPEIALNIMFRDYLRSNTEARNNYARLKQELMQDPSSQEKAGGYFRNYTLRKGKFIRDILTVSGFDRFRILRCSEGTEWDAAKRLGASIEAALDEENAHLMLYRGSSIIGYAHIHFSQGGRAIIHTMRIEKAYVGAEDIFLSFCEKWVKSLGIDILEKAL